MGFNLLHAIEGAAKAFVTTGNPVAAAIGGVAGGFEAGDGSGGSAASSSIPALFGGADRIGGSRISLVDPVAEIFGNDDGVV